MRGSLRGFKRALQRTTVDELSGLYSSQKIARLQRLVNKAITTSLGGIETSGECINFVLENVLSPEMFNNNQDLQTLFRGLTNAYSFKLTGQIVRSGDQGLINSFPNFIFMDGRLFGARDILTNFGNPFPGSLSTISYPRSLDGLTESTIPTLLNEETTLTVDLDSAVLPPESISQELRPYTNEISTTMVRSLLNAGYRAVDRGAQINGEIFFQVGSRLQELRDEGIIS